MPWFAMKPIDATFFETAPEIHRDTMEIPKPAGDVWRELTRDGSLDFCRLLSGAQWTSPRPFGVGTTRTMKVGFGALAIHETFFRWEEGKRYSFYVSEANLPLFRRFGEDYLVEEVSPTSCRFTWTLAADPPPAARAGAPLNKLLVKSFFSDARKHFGAK